MCVHTFHMSSLYILYCVVCIVHTYTHTVYVHSVYIDRLFLSYSAHRALTLRVGNFFLCSLIPFPRINQCFRFSLIFSENLKKEHVSKSQTHISYQIRGLICVGVHYWNNKKMSLRMRIVKHQTAIPSAQPECSSLIINVHF